MNVAIIEKSKSGIKWEDYFNFDYEVLYLSSKKVGKKFLKKDIDLEFDAEEYDIIITVGGEPTKFIAKKNSVVTYQGLLVNEKYIPITSPNMLSFRPDAAPAFHNAVEYINKVVDGGGKDVPETTKLLLDTEAKAKDYLERLIADKPTTVAVDTETTGLYPRQGYLLGLSMTYKENEGVYIPVEIADIRSVWKLLQEIFNTCTTVFHNAKFDMPFLRYHLELEVPNWEDTILIHYCLDERPGTHGLKTLAIKYTPFGDYESELVDYKKTFCRKHGLKEEQFDFSYIPIDVLYKYACMDTIVTYNVYNQFIPILKEDKQLVKLYNDILKPGTHLCIDMEENGVPFKKEKVQEADKILEDKVFKIEQKLYSYPEVKEFEDIHGKINFGSYNQLRKLLYGHLGLKPISFTDTGEPSTNEETLKILSKEHDIPGIIIDLRKLKSIRNKYVTKLLTAFDRDGRVRTNFNLASTLSGRLSSSGKLNMQNIPRDDKTVKQCIVARPGYKIVSIDLGTGEMWLAAQLSKDKALLDFFKTGKDYHGFMAVNKFGLKCDPNEVAELYPDLRQEAKTISFEILYKLNLEDPILKMFPQLKVWLKRQRDIALKTGELRQFFGRKRRLHNINSNNSGIREHEIRSGINSLVQGPLSDINLIACIRLNEWIKTAGYKKEMLIFAMVHDSIIAEVKEDLIPEYEKMAKHFIQNLNPVSISPKIGVDVEVGNDYSFK